MERKYINIIVDVKKYKDEEMLKKYLKKYKIEELYNLKLYIDNIYHNALNEDEELILETIDDWQYDILEKIIKEINPNYKPTVGATIRVGDNKIKLPYWLGSMDKIKPEDTNELDRWINKNPSETYITESKLDGISCLLVVKNKQMKLYTRGDGIIGSDISDLREYFKTIPNVKENIAVRGELIMKTKIFQKKYSNIAANPRNLVAGRIGGKKLREGLTDIDFIAYEVVGDEEMTSPSEQLDRLKKLGFKVVKSEIIEEITKEELINIYLKYKKESEYEIDGIIVQPDLNYERNTSGNPNYAFAFKMRINENIAKAKVVKVEWNISKWGLLKPRVEIEPIQLSGVKITYATGFNAKYINDNKIGKGAEIKITRSGDVIPFIIEVIKPAKKAELPENITYEWNDTGVDIITMDFEDKKCIKLISSFFSQMGIKYISNSTINKLYMNGYTSLIKIIKLNPKDIEKIEGFQKRSAERIYENIVNGLKNITIPDVLGACGIFGQGIAKKKLEVLFNSIPNLLDIYKTKNNEELLNDILKVDGFSTITAKQIINNIIWADLFIKILHKIPFVTFKVNIKISNILDGKYILFSGFRDSNMEKLIKERGGIIEKSLTKKTSYLVVNMNNDLTSNKPKEAKEKGIPIYNNEEFFNKFLI
jgi:DNA ligase (NAD+)